MSGLVGYASSDEEDVDVDVEDASAERSELNQNGQVRAQPGVVTAPTASQLAPEPVTELREDLPTVARGPQPDQATEVQDEVNDGSMSPYSANRARIQSVTMPRYADFNIPPSPPPPEPMTAEAAALAATTKKFERFRELKKQGVHFNARLESSTALRNPALSQKLFEFADIEPSEQYENTLGDAFGVPMRWPDGFLETLVKDNEKRVRREREGRSKVDFVPARKKA